ncbi:hypothetical protein SPSIL_055760 [Sporomusa silvacetica DSM 10669]|uniref:Uncharacterized protein n=1 Tax=Sporomusa silvacetica DSM 10669 TaxID=1123289 RepID=A0ABZ3IVE9_9FIRM|nr:hypothetical protein [Sporomusa silvacetica]OZC23902.1 hypothetical protein SPSIL_00630 [Sporomusa silvacetica DSM 10669]
MDNVSDDLNIKLTEEELRELLDGLPDIIRDLKEESDAPEITN